MKIAGQDVQRMVRGSTRSLTMWFAVGLAVFGALQLEADHLAPLIPAQAFGLFNILVGVAVAILRVLTTMPLEDKAPE